MSSRSTMILVLIALVLASGPWAQTRLPGEITGRIADMEHGALPGVRVVVTGGSTRRETITDTRGRFVVNDLAPGSYTVTVDLAGFFTRSGTVDLAGVPRAYLDWPLEVGCLAEEVRVQHHARAAARLADAVAYVRMGANHGDVQWSHRPACGYRWREFSMTITQIAAGRVRPGVSAASPAPVRLFVSPYSGDVATGGDFIVFLWETRPLSDVWHTGGQMVLPVGEDQRVAAPWDKDVHGLRASEAMTQLERWSRERR